MADVSLDAERKRVDDALAAVDTDNLNEVDKQVHSACVQALDNATKAYTIATDQFVVFLEDVARRQNEPEPEPQPAPAA